jgi:hypothetical protein
MKNIDTIVAVIEELIDAKIEVAKYTNDRYGYVPGVKNSAVIDARLNLRQALLEAE